MRELDYTSDASSNGRTHVSFHHNTTDNSEHSEFNAYKAALNKHAIVAATDKSGTILSVNDKFCEISKYSRDELIGANHSILNSRHHPPIFFQNMWRRIQSGNFWNGEIRNKAKDGSIYWVDTTIVPKFNDFGSIEGFLSIRFDITKRKNIENELITENATRKNIESLLRDIIDTIPSGVIAFDEDDQVILYNSSYKKFYKLSESIINHGEKYENILKHGIENDQYFLPRNDPQYKSDWLAARMNDHLHPGRRLIERLNDGRWLQVQERKSDSGNLVCVQTDITDIKLAEHQIKQQAERDSLTGLYNRRVLHERLDKALRANRRPARCGALIIVDLDDFKNVNDLLGHDAGDILLVEVGERLKQSVRKSDIVARLGGDEFALLLQNLNDDQDAERIAAKILQTFSDPIKVGTRTIPTKASLGIATFHQGKNTPTDLIKKADLALYQAKKAGRNTYAVYSPNFRADIRRRAVLANSLRKALLHDEIDIALQPQLNLENQRHAGFEALVRWQIGNRNIPPPLLIEVAEEAGLIVELGYRIIDKALSAIAALQAQSLDAGPVAINVTAAQLLDPNFSEKIYQMIEDHDLQPHDVEIEVTENVMLDHSSEEITQVLFEIHHLGIGISLDDFGTGYASLSHLKRFPIDRIKIDQSFVKGIDVNIDDAVIVKTIISLAHNLDLKVVAEGVESKQHVKILSNYGCDFIQGYYISRPLPLKNAIEYLNASISNQTAL